MSKQICTVQLRRALRQRNMASYSVLSWIFLIAILGCCQSEPCRAVSLTIIAPGVEGGLVEVVDLNDTGHVQHVTTYTAPAIPLDRKSPLRHTAADEFSVQLMGVAISPDRSFVAVNYNKDLPNYPRSHIKLYSLKDGTFVGTLPTQNRPSAHIVWCVWRTNDELEFTDHFLQDHDIEVAEVRTYFVTTRQTQLLHTTTMTNGWHPDPDDYFVRAKRAAVKFKNAGFKPIPSYTRRHEFDFTVFGGYGGSNEGKVSDGGTYAIASVVASRGQEYVVLRSGKRQATIRLSRTMVVHRVKFLDHLVVFAMSDRGKNIIEWFSSDTGKRLGMRNGIYIVD